MRNTLFIFSLLLSGFFADAQTSSRDNATILVEKLLNTKVFTDYAVVKKDIEGQVIALNQQPNISEADYAALQLAYNHTKEGFDAFLGVVRQDMLDYQLFEKATEGDEMTLLRYTMAYNSSLDIYKREFAPAYNRVYKTRALPVWLVPLGIQAFEFLGTLFKGKNARKEVMVNDMLMVSKYLFLQKMQMKYWEELVTVQPGAAPATGDASGNTTLVAKSPGYTSPSVSVEYPAMKSLSGQIEFVVAGNPASSMLFEPFSGVSRDLVVTGASNTGSSSVATLNVPHLRTVNTWGEGTSFQIRVQNSALLYAFTLNSNGTCSAIYPFSEAWVNGFNMSKSRDLSVGPLMLRNDQGIVTIPSRNATTGEENYIRISGNSAKEQMCLIVSMSELDLNDVMARIGQLPGSLAERVTALWQSEPHCATAAEAQLQVQGSSIRFNVTDAGKWFVPLSFEIRR